MMNEREAWLFLAKQWDAARRWGGWAAYCSAMVYGCPRGSLCTSIMTLFTHRDITAKIECLMMDKIHAALNKRSDAEKLAYGDYLFCRDEVGAKQRAAFCRQQTQLLEQL